MGRRGWPELSASWALTPLKGAAQARLRVPAPGGSYLTPPAPERGTNPRRKSGVTALARNSCTAEIADPVSPSAGSARFEVKHRTGGLRSGGIKRATESWRGRYGWQRQRWQEQQDSRIQERQRKATGKERQEGREGHPLNLMGVGLGLVNPPPTLSESRE